MNTTDIATNRGYISKAERNSIAPKSGMSSSSDSMGGLMAQLIYDAMHDELQEGLSEIDEGIIAHSAVQHFLRLLGAYARWAGSSQNYRLPDIVVGSNGALAISQSKATGARCSVFLMPTGLTRWVETLPNGSQPINVAVYGLSDASVLSFDLS